MLTSKETAIFFFAHQDDEFGVFLDLTVAKALGRYVICVYLTTGVPSGCAPTKRNNESVRVLEKFGVDEVIFLGDTLLIPDGALSENLSNAYGAIKKFLETQMRVASVHIPAWEGGHPDHDALHALVVHVSFLLSIDEIVCQFPLYNGFLCPWKFFRILSPLRANGTVENAPISVRDRFRFFRLSFLYPSQLGTWIGLAPFLLIHYIFSPYQSRQAVSRFRILERPHPGVLYYEKRNFSTWEILAKRIGELILLR